MDDVLAALDAGLQSSPESDLYNDVAPSVGTGCVRCPSDVVEGGELCGGCRAFLLGDSELDPAAARASDRPCPVCGADHGPGGNEWAEGGPPAWSVPSAACTCLMCRAARGELADPVVAAPTDEATLRLDLLLYGNAYEVDGRRVAPTDVTVITSEEFTAQTTEARRWRLGDGATAVADVVRVRVRPPSGPPDDRGGQVTEVVRDVDAAGRVTMFGFTIRVPNEPHRFPTPEGETDVYDGASDTYWAGRCLVCGEAGHHSGQCTRTDMTGPRGFMPREPESQSERARARELRFLDGLRRQQRRTNRWGQPGR